MLAERNVKEPSTGMYKSTEGEEREDRGTGRRSENPVLTTLKVSEEDHEELIFKDKSSKETESKKEKLKLEK